MIPRARVAVAIAVAIAARSATAAPPLEVHARRGIAGVVATTGIDLAEIELRSAADVAVTANVIVAGHARRVDLAARGRAVVTIAQRVPAGATQLAAERIVVRANRGVIGSDLWAELPAVRVVPRPVLVITDDPLSLLPRVDEWRRREQLGSPIALEVSQAARWQTLVGIGAIVVDRPLSALEPAVGSSVKRYVAMGGRVCRFTAGAQPACNEPMPIVGPQSPHPATIDTLVGRFAIVALALAVVLVVAATGGRRRGTRVLIGCVAIAGAAIVPLVGYGARPANIAGVIANVDEREDWVVAAVGIADDGRVLPLAGELWIEPFTPSDRPGFDEAGLAGRVPGPGSWLVRGFVPPGASWTRRLQRIHRALPEVP